MHELSIAMSIVEMGEEEADRRGAARVLAVHLRLGQLTGIVKESLISSYQMASEATLLEGSRLLIEEIPIEIFCSPCNAQRPVQSIQWFICPECGTPSSNVVKGKELEVVAMEIEE